MDWAWWNHAIRVLLVPATSKRWRVWRVVEYQFLVNVAGGGFLGEVFFEKVEEGGLYLEGFLAGFGGFRFYFGIYSNENVIQ